MTLFPAPTDQRILASRLTTEDLQLISTIVFPGGTGRIRCVYPGSDWPDEIAEAGDVYFFAAGYTLIYEADTKALELNLAAALQVLMDHIEARSRTHLGSS